MPGLASPTVHAVSPETGKEVTGERPPNVMRLRPETRTVVIAHVKSAGSG